MRLRLFWLSCVTLLVASTSSPGFAQTTRNVPAQYTTIASAISAASSGDTILVNGSSATFHEHVDFGGKKLTLQAATTGGVTLNGDGAGPVITISGSTAEGSQVIGFNITNAGKPQSTGGAQGAVVVTGASVTLQYNTFTANYCAAIAVSSANPQILNNTITGTLNTGCAAGEGEGSAVVISGYSTSSTLFEAALIQGNTISSNVKSLAYSTDNGGGGGLNITGANKVWIYSNRLMNNTSTGYGGAMYMASTPYLNFVGNLVVGNAGDSGGLDIVVPGISVGPTAGVIANNTIGYNTANSSNAGSDVYLAGNLAQYQFVNNILVATTSKAALNCGKTYASQTVTPLVIDHNDLYSTGSGAAVGGDCTAPGTKDGNLATNPQFVSVSSTTIANGTADFHVQTGSATIDAGNNSVIPMLATDFDGMARLYDATGKGYAVIDMGVYEKGAPASCSGTACSVLTPTSLLLTPSNYSPAAGTAITLTAAFQNAALPDSGTVTFSEDEAAVGTGSISGGVATFLTGKLTQGTHLFRADYAGDTQFAPASSIYIVILVGAPSAATTLTLLNSSKNPSVYGDTVTFTATVTASDGTVPTGTVYFTDGAASLGQKGLDANGQAAVSSSTLKVGSHSLVAAFASSNSLPGSAGDLTQVVTAAPLLTSTVALVNLPATADAGSKLALTAVVSTSGTVAPTGTVSFTDGSTTLGSGAVSALSASSGQAVLSTPALTAGEHHFGCSYSGDSVYDKSSCAVGEVNAQAVSSTLTLTASSLTPYALTPFTVTVHLVAGSNPVSGAVTLSYNGTQQTVTTNASGDAVVTLTLPAGEQSISGVAAASSIYTQSNTASTTVNVQRNQVSGTLLASPVTSYQGQTVSFTVTLADQTGTVSPAGSVVLLEGATTVGSANLPAAVLGQTVATVTIPVTGLSVGDHTITAVYQPDNNSVAGNIAPLTVTVLASSFTITPDPGSITIQTQHHKSMLVKVTSVGAFSGTVQLGCVTPLPQVLACTFAQPTLTLSAGATVESSLNLETSAIANFYAANQQKQERLTALAASGLLAAALCFRRRRALRNLALTGLLMAGVLGVSGCSGKWPDHTPPGTYTITVQGYGTQPGVGNTTKTAQFQLVVTP
ncbi:MAG: Ig-like domain repeat protein [Acidobacteriaceae bacterium]|nr:Ig-like domain repeat protein [Acidobacteriaceae bacterium]